MITLIDLPVDSSENLNVALQRVDALLEPLRPYVSKNNIRRKDIKM